MSDAHRFKLTNLNLPHHKCKFFQLILKHFACYQDIELPQEDPASQVYIKKRIMFYLIQFLKRYACQFCRFATNVIFQGTKRFYILLGCMFSNTVTYFYLRPSGGRFCASYFVTLNRFLWWYPFKALKQLCNFVFDGFPHLVNTKL